MRYNDRIKFNPTIRGACALSLMCLIGLVCLAACSQPMPRPGNPSPLSSPLVTFKSPAALPVAVAPTFQLTVLHTNDTWGYLLPCG